MHRPITADVKKKIISKITIVAPGGVDHRIERITPAAAPMTARPAEQNITARKLRNMRIAESAGKMISAETRSYPTRFIASTITTAVTAAIIIL